MDPAEYREWFRYHSAKFTGVIKWLNSLPDTSHDETPTRSDAMQSWRRTLSRTSLPDALAATDEMGSESFPEPRGWDRHPLAIAARAKKLRGHADTDQPGELQPKYVDGVQVYRCPQCRDLGLVSVWHPKSMRSALNGTLGQPFTVYSTPVKCDQCDVADQKGYGWMPLTFQPKTMLEIPRPDPERDAKAELVEWMQQRAADRKAGKPAHGFDEFKEYAVTESQGELFKQDGDF